MNYRHAYHAGNFADVLKHTALVAVLRHLQKKSAPFAVIDTHAGRGLYDIGGTEASLTGEAKDGILRLLSAEIPTGPLADYAEIVRGFGAGFYPGSPLIAARMLREKDRVVAIEKHPEEKAALATVFNGLRGARTILGDGYSQLARLLPPPERRGVILIDPPYEEYDEFLSAARALIGAHRRFATGVFLLWYPAKDSSLANSAAGEFANAGIRSLLRLELDVCAPPGETRLSATGLFVVNPPFGFAREMKAAADFLAGVFARSASASAWLEIITGEA